MSMVEEKLDAEGQRDLRWKLKRLEREVALGQEDTTQKVVKMAKRRQSIGF